MYGRVFYFRGPMSTYNKPYLTFQQQLELLKSRGLGVTDDAAALSYLGRIGYYRLSAYWYSFRKSALLQDPATKKITVQRLDDFYPGYTFQQALDLYVFDKRLRLLVLDAIDRIEVAIRVDIAKRQTRASQRKTELSEAARGLQGAANLSELAGIFLSEAHHQLGVLQGTVYLLQPERQSLELIGSYACATAPPANLALGEGLLGQCVVERKSNVIRTDTGAFAMVHSGLGDSRNWPTGSAACQHRSRRKRHDRRR